MKRVIAIVGLLAAASVGRLDVSAQAPAVTPTSREVHYTRRSVVRVNARLRFTTMIILPEKEEILDFVCGDKDFWIVSGSQNLAYVKPAKAGAMTNLNLVTASGAVYSFLLTEGSGDPDLNVYIEADDAEQPAAKTKRYYTADDVADLKRIAEEARKEADDAHASVAKTVEDRVAFFRSTYPVGLQFPYRFKAHEKPFNVSAIYTDGAFTYIRANAPELPALYEVRDHVPNLVNFQVDHGVYVVTKVLESGYLAIGKQRLVFEAER
jgi:type IV secretion system protein VirB9